MQRLFPLCAGEACPHREATTAGEAKAGLEEGLVIAVQIGIAIPQTHPDPRLLARFLPRAEALGFDAAWAIDQLSGVMPVAEPLVTLGHAAALTRRMRLGVSVLVLPQREPVHLAKALSSIDALSEGRLIVGVGLGHGSRLYEALGLAPEGRVTRMRENLEIMRRLWSEPRASFEGRFARLDGVAMEPKPLRRPPVWFGGHAEAALHRAVALGDGFMGAGSTSIDDFLAELAIVRELLGTRSDFTLAKRLYVSCVDDLPDVRAWFDGFYRQPDLADRVAVWGSSDAVVDAVMRLRDAGVTHVLLHPVTDVENQLERLATEVMPRLRGA